VTELFEQGDDQVVCDGNQIEQALVALLVNAVEAMPNGGTLTVCAADRGRSVRIRVADNGVGIPPEIQRQIFEPFFSTKDRTGGVGLGLSVAYGIIRRHGGEITVRSAVDRGTTFTIDLPRQPVTEDHHQRENHHEQRETESNERHAPRR
jgi:two-component system NtrC family sensor kinase